MARVNGVRSTIKWTPLGGVDIHMVVAETRNRLVGRDDSLAEVAAALAAGRSGAVVVGSLGIGKTALVRAAAAHPDFYVVSIRGTRISQKTSLGALAWLISDLPEDLVSRPAQLVQELESLLVRRAGGKRILLLLNGAEYLDDLTAMAVSQLVRRSAVSILATAEHLFGSAPEFLSLWTEGLLHRIDLAPLGMEHTRELMQVILGQPVSTAAALAVQHYSGGNPHLITLLTGEQTGEGSLVLQDGIWVLAKPLAFSELVAEVVSVRLKRLPPAARSLIQLLALADELPLDTVLQLIPAETVDALEEELAVQVSNTGMIRLAAGTSSTAIAGCIPPGRSRELWEEVTAILDQGLLTASALAGFARWTLACHGTLDPETAYRAARLAVASGEAALGVQYIQSVPAGRRTQAMVLQEVRALTACGDYSGAVSALERLTPGDDTGDLNSWAELMRHRTILLRLLPEHGDPAELLERAGLDLPSGETESDRRIRQAAIVLVRSALALDTGCMGEVPRGLAGIGPDLDLPAAVRARATALQAQFLALSGRGEQALELLETVPQGWGAALSPSMWDSVQARIFFALVAAGEYARAHELVGQLKDGGSLRVFRGSAGDVADGVVHALAGQADRAHAALAPSICQLKFHDPTDLLPMAQTISAYAQLLLGNQEEAKRCARDGSGNRYQPLAQLQLLTQLLRVQVELAGDPAELCSELRAMARSCRERGLIAPALDCLAAAARHGDSQAARELADATATAEGRGARMLHCFGAGTDRQDPALLLEAARQATELGNTLLANTAARSVLSLLGSRTDALSRTQTRQARTLEHLSFRKLRDANTVAALMGAMTPFEADLARRAAGPSTRAEISSALNLSPRTIDWHLGKIFDMLHVSGRPELSEVLAPART